MTSPALLKERVRPGGRSARVQESVHGAVRMLLTEGTRADLTVPVIAARAGVTPSTIYRRWGDLQTLLADVAAERLRPDADPADTGSLRGDLRTWLDQFVDEVSSAPGLEMLRDVIATHTPGRNPCCSYTRTHLAVIAERAQARAETCPGVEPMLDQIVAPIIYRIVFGGETISTRYAHGLVDRCLGSVD